ncbi:MAG: polyphenol oxidase family protein [Desulfohalobiaceae bacterium]
MSENHVISFQFPGLSEVGCAFTTRKGGVSQGPYAWNNLSYSVGDQERNVQRNRDCLQAQLDVQSLCCLQQIHSSKMVCIQEQHTQPGPVQQADAMTAELQGLALMIQTADCQPLLLAHCSGKYIAALHVGWRANRAGAPGQWVQQFCRTYALRPDDILAVRGPSLGPWNSQFLNFEQEWGQGFLPYFQPETRTMDLWSLTRDQLLQAGVPEQSIFSLDLCTFQLQQEFFSYRRQGVCGRQAGLIWIRQPWDQHRVS